VGKADTVVSVHCDGDRALLGMYLISGVLHCRGNK